MSNTILKQVALLCALSFTVLSTHALQGDTLIPTQSGNKAIKDIKVGDLVLSKDETTNQMGYQSVTHHHNEEYSQTVYLNVVDEMGNSQTIITNKTHPFFAQTDSLIPSSEGYVYQGDIDGADWVDASNLKVGDKLLSQDGKWQTVQSIKVANQPLTAYHLTVNNSHTYFVATSGKYGVWVHNNNVCYLPAPMTAEQRRLSAGKAFSSRHLVELKMGESLFKGENSAPVPKQVADKLSCRSFKNFNEFRSAFWKEMANDPAVAQNFSPQNIGLMKKGNAPFAPIPQQVGKRTVYELDHNIEIQDGGTVYNLDNIIIRTPSDHIEKGRNR